MAASLTLEQALLRRQALMNQINDQDVRALNGLTRRGPKSIDLEAMKGRVDELKQINSRIEQKKQDSLQKKKCCCLGAREVKATTWVLFAFSFVAWCVITGVSIYTVATETDDEKRKRSVAQLVGEVFVLFLTTVVGGLIKGISDDKDSASLVAQVSRIERTGEELKQFLEDFSEFRKSQEKAKIAPCIHSFDLMPETGIRSRMPSREYWVSLFIEMLPEDEPIKKKFAGLSAAAHAIHEIEEEDSEPTLLALPEKAGSSSDTLKVEAEPEKKYKRSRHKTHHHHHTKKPKEASSSEDDTPPEKSKFRGERASLPNWFAEAARTVPLRPPSAKEKAKMESVEKELSAGAEVSIPLRHRFRAEWKSMERELGCNFDCLRLGDHSIDREGNFADDITKLPAYTPRQEPPLRLPSEFNKDADKLV